MRASSNSTPAAAGGIGGGAARTFGTQPWLERLIRKSGTCRKCSLFRVGAERAGGRDRAPQPLSYTVQNLRGARNRCEPHKRLLVPFQEFPWSLNSRFWLASAFLFAAITRITGYGASQRNRPPRKSLE